MNTDFKIPESLKKALKTGKVVPFVGAGLSMSVKKKNADGTESDESLFPNWKGFIEYLIEALRNKNEHNTAEFIRLGIETEHLTFLDALQKLQESLGKTIWYNCFQECFDKSEDEASINSLKLNKLVWELSNNLIITTNVDCVFQWTCPKSTGFRLLDVQSVEYANLQNEEKLHRPTVWYLHGHIDNKDKVIFTRDQFDSFYKQKDNEAKFQTLLNFLTNRTIVFMGFSLEDDYLRELLKYIHDIYKGGADSCFILFREKDIPNANFPKEVTPVPFSEFGKPLEDLLEELVRIAKGPIVKKNDDPITDSLALARSKEKERLKNHFNVPFPSKGEAFVGREGLRELIWEKLNKSGRSAISQAVNITGIGGLGKTQLAVEYAEKYRDRYENGVFWLTADEDITAQLNQIGESLNWISQSDEGFDQAELVRSRFRKVTDCLIIFDNVDEKEAIEKYLPERDAHPHILATSREKLSSFDEIKLNLLSKKESSRLLLETSNRSIENEKEQKAFDEILKELDNFPLAIELVGGFLTEHPSIAFHEYLGFFEDMLLEKINEEFPLVSFTKHEQSIIRTLKINEKLLKEKPHLEDILDVLAWSGSSPMGYSLLQALTAIENHGVLTIALSNLSNLLLIKEEKDTKRYTIHRLLAKVRRHEKPLKDRAEWHKEIVKNLENWFRKQDEEEKTLSCAEPELEHLEIWQKNTLEYLPAKAVWLTLLKASPLVERGNYKEAQKYIEEANELYYAENLTDKLLLANLFKNFGWLEYYLGNYERSKEYAEKALEFYDKGIINEKKLLTSLNIILANYYSEVGNNIKALELDQLVLSMCYELFGKKHPRVAHALNNLGVSYRNLEEHDKELELAQQSLEMRRDLFGEKHPKVALSLYNVGVAYGYLGNYEKDLELAQQSLEMRRELFSEKHPDISHSLYSLALAYSRSGNYEKSLELNQQALEMRYELFGDNHPEIAASLNNLGVQYNYLGNYEKALEIYLQGLEIRRKTSGVKHPETIRICRNLILVLSITGKTEDAAKLADEFLSYDLPNFYDKWFFEEYSKKKKTTDK